MAEQVVGRANLVCVCVSVCVFFLGGGEVGALFHTAHFYEKYYAFFSVFGKQR